MSTYNSIAWVPLCAGLTALGLVLTYIVARRRGWRAMLRGAAWSLLPLAAYLTGSIEMFWKIGTAIGNFATAFAFSTQKWAGIGVAGLAVALFLVSGGRARRKAVRAARRKQSAADAPGATLPIPEAREPGAVMPANPTRALAKPSSSSAPPGDDLKDIEEILRKHGI